MSRFRVSDPDLELRGPRVEAEIGADELHVAFLEQSGLSRLPSGRGVALIDTGSNLSYVRPSLIEATGAKAYDEVEVSPGVSVAQCQSWWCPVYQATIRLLLDEEPFQGFLVAASITLPDIACIIGRDILSRGVFTYDGRRSRFEVHVTGHR